MLEAAIKEPFKISSNQKTVIPLVNLGDIDFESITSNLPKVNTDISFVSNNLISTRNHL